MKRVLYGLGFAMLSIIGFVEQTIEHDVSLHVFKPYDKIDFVILTTIMISAAAAIYLLCPHSFKSSTSKLSEE